MKEIKFKDFPIKGFIPVTLLDWPGKIAAMIFTPQCDFRCPFCYNLELVLYPGKLPNIKLEEVINHLLKRKKWLDGLVIGGGEPTIWPGLPNFCQKIKSLGFKIHLQTNGSKPAVLEKLINDKLVDYLAIDIKGPLEEYPQITRSKIKPAEIQKSVGLIKRYPQIEAEFRTTVVPGLIDEEEIEKIGKWLGPNFRIPYYLQQFRAEKTLDPRFQKIRPYTEEKLKKLRKTALKYFKKVEIRGV